MPKTVLFFIIFIIVASVLIIGGSYLWKNRSSSVQKNLPNAKTQKPVQPTQQTNDRLPVNPSMEGVKEAAINYVFSTTITSIASTSSGLSVKTPIQDAKIPSFSIVKDTKVIFNDGGKETPAAPKDLKTGQRIVAITDFNLKRQIWSTRKIHILKGQSLLSSPSASVKP